MGPGIGGGRTKQSCRVSTRQPCAPLLDSPHKEPGSFKRKGQIMHDPLYAPLIGWQELSELGRQQVTVAEPIAVNRVPNDTLTAIALNNLSGHVLPQVRVFIDNAIAI